MVTPCGKCERILENKAASATKIDFVPISLDADNNEYIFIRFKIMNSDNFFFLFILGIAFTER